MANEENGAPVTNLMMVRGEQDTTVHEGGGVSMGSAGVLRFRILTIQMGLEAEMMGYRLTSRAPRCFKIIADEFGIKVKRSKDGKRAAYVTFCTKFGLTPKARFLEEAK